MQSVIFSSKPVVITGRISNKVILLGHWPGLLIVADYYCAMTSLSKDLLGHCDGLLTAPFLWKSTFPDYHQGSLSASAPLTTPCGRGTYGLPPLTVFCFLLLIDFFEPVGNLLPIQSNLLFRLKYFTKTLFLPYHHLLGGL